MRTALSLVANTSTFEINRTVRDFGDCDRNLRNPSIVL